MNREIFSLVQSMLSPAVMISCCGVLLLSLVPKLGRVLDRIRILNQEKIFIAKKINLDEADRHRLKSLDQQTTMLIHRAELLKNSSGLTLLGILFFVITSVFIGITFMTGVNLAIFTIISFLIGMVIVLIGVFLAYWETHISHYTIVEEIGAAQDVVKTLLSKSR